MGIFGVCAQPQEPVDQAMKEWGLHFQCFSDPTHTLRNYLDKEGLISIHISGGENATDSSFYQSHPQIKHYKHGVAQPGVLCVKPDRTVLYAWAINPSFMNLGGASDRPVPADIWGLVQAKMSDPANADALPTRLRSRGALSVCTIL